MLTRQLLDLLDLKSKTASLIAAQASLRAARSSAATATHGLREAQSTRTQGRAVILFTIVTVIFVGRTLYSTPLFLTGLTAPALVLLILLWPKCLGNYGRRQKPFFLAPMASCK
jgi:hypothetical protein